MMRKKRKRKQPGLAPGTLEFTGEQRMEKTLVLQVRYNTTEVTKREMSEGEKMTVPEDQVTWYDIRGLHDVKLIESIGSCLNIHPLVLEDVLHTLQRPKFEEYGNEAFIIVSALKFDTLRAELETEQVGIYYGKNFLLTFQENPDDTFSILRERLETNQSSIRTRKGDYLAYALIDNIVDQYFEVLDQIEEHIEQIEIEISSNPSHFTREKIHRFKYQMLTLRRAVVPLREAVNRFSRSETAFLEESTVFFVRDLYDHIIRITDIIETYRDMLNGLQDLYLSELSMRMNKIIQFLTVITTIFVPLTFLVGIYGMNFDNMPELHWKYGYFYLLGFMALITAGLIIFFKRKKWL